MGAGGFGRHHLDEWLKLAAEDEATLAGVVVRSEAVPPSPMVTL